MSLSIRLVDYLDDSIWHGNILRVRGKYPYEELVDFMLFKAFSKNSDYGLIVTSGYKAGLVLVAFPRESASVGGGVSKDWIVSNWHKWIYPDCDVNDVFIIDRYDVDDK